MLRVLFSPNSFVRIALLAGLPPWLGLFGKHHWLLDLCSHFQAQCLAVSLLAVLILFVWRKWKPAALACCALILPASNLLPLFWPKSVKPTPQLHVATFNILGTSRQYTEATQWILDESPEIIYLPESNETWLDALRSLDATYPHKIDHFIEGNFGFSFRSKHPITRSAIHALGTMKLPLLEAHIITPLGEVTVFAAHPVPPVTDYWASERDAYLTETANRIRQSTGRVILLGDLNATRWSHVFSQFRNAGLDDSADGHGLHATWMRENPLMAVPIDHILSRGFQGTYRRSVGPALGSDHRPVSAVLVW